MALSTLVILTAWTSQSWAFETYSQNRDGTNCRQCHGDFRATGYASFTDGTPWTGGNTSLHDGHRQTMLASDCNTCHSAGGRFPVLLDSSVGGNGLDPIACAGCHGRAEDALAGGGPAAGLRQHHWNSGVQVCLDCHNDANPANLTTVAENVPPPYYFAPDAAHPAKPTDACDINGSESVFGPTGLDNDGNLFYDGADLSCAMNQPPVANANGPYNGTVSIALSFDGTASNDPDGTIVSYDWDFGDGTLDLNVGPTPSHTYLVDGPYTVTLTVTDDAAATGTDTTTATIGVGNQPPVANANGPYTGTVGVAVAFDGSASIDPDGTIVTYEWDFGDTGTGTGVSPSHTYLVDGTYNVTLTVTDDAGATGTAATTAAIGPVVNLPPTADANGPYTGTVGIPVAFDGSASNDPDGTIVSYLWVFGDGHTGTGPSPSNTYLVDGVYTVTLTVTDDAGAIGTDTTAATIGPVPNLPPTADPNGPYAGTVGLPVAFDGSASNDPDGTIVTYEWDFGDGGSGTGATPSHTYLADGVFTVTLTVTDNAGAVDSASTSATIGVGNLPPVADPNGPYAGTVGIPVAFDGTASSDPDGSIVAFDWEFGDGGSGTGATPSHAYAVAGTYNVTLTVTDDAGATGSAMTTAAIEPVPNLPPVADPNGPYSGTVGIPVAFDGTASNDPDGTIVAFEWNFGDGNLGTGATPSHTYLVGGVFIVTLTVTDNAGAVDSTTTTATIDAGNLPPVADPNGPYAGTTGVPVAFDGTASSDPDGSIVAFDWDFGDGGSGTGATPSHAYAVAGTYNVTLTVTDDAGATGTAATTAAISDPGALDLDIDRFKVTRQVHLKTKKMKAIEIRLDVKNNGTEEGSALATISGVQNGVEVYHETLLVTDPVGDGRTRFDDDSVPSIPTFMPTMAGKILWTATIDDGNPDLDQAMAVTRVVSKGRDDHDDDDDDDDDDRDRDRDKDKDKDRDRDRD